MTENVIPLHSSVQMLPTSVEPILYNDPSVATRRGVHQRQAERERRRHASRHRSVVARCAGTLRAVAEMHAPRIYPDLYFPGDDPTCDGCDIDLDNMDAGAPPWPCSTFELIEESS